MTRRINFLFVLTVGFAFMTATLVAQPLVSEQGSDDNISILTKENKTPYPPKPKDMWEVNLHAGTLGVGGDVAPRLPFSGLGFGVGVRKSLGYTWSLRGDFVYGNAYGLALTSNGASTATVGEITTLGYSSAVPFAFNHKTTYASFGVQAIYNLTNIKFHGNASKLGIYAVAGIGAFTVNTSFDARNSSGIYDFNTILAGAGTVGSDNYNRDARERITGALDGEYETAAPKKRSSGRDVIVNPSLQLGMGIAYRLSDKIALGIEPQVHLTTNDYIDGVAFRSAGVPSSSADAVVYVPLKLSVFLGDAKKQSIPLYWVNPLDKPMSDIAANTKKKDIAELMVDADNDGVPDWLDKELDTPAGAEVDTRGVTMDSDRDGIPNHLDKEPYSPIGYKIDPQTGIAQQPPAPKVLSEADVIALGKREGWDKPTNTGGSGVSEWFLPMIHFDNDSYAVKPQAYSALDQVATVMKNYPSISIVVEGHASSEGSASYNMRLSEKRANAAVNYLVSNYGIDRSRLSVSSQGKTDFLVKSAPSNYMNRRVEFKVAK